MDKVGNKGKRRRGQSRNIAGHWLLHGEHLAVTEIDAGVQWFSGAIVGVWWGIVLLSPMASVACGSGSPGSP